MKRYMSPKAQLVSINTQKVYANHTKYITMKQHFTHVTNPSRSHGSTVGSWDIAIPSMMDVVRLPAECRRCGAGLFMDCCRS